MVTGEVAPDARKPCAIVHEKRPKLGPTAKRAKSAGKRRKGAQCCGNVSKRAGTNGNVWKHRFGWVPGKSVSRVHGRPENPSPVASRPGTGGKVWKHVKTGGNKCKRVETTIRMVTVKVGKSGSRNPRKTRVRWRVGREPVERCGNMSKRAATSGNVWKQRFGWVRGKSVSRVHGRPEKPESGGESAGNRWRGVETCQNGRQQVETCGNNDSDGYRESR